MDEKPVELSIRAIEPGDKFTGLKLGDEAFAPLKTFLQKDAHKFERQSLARTYGAFDESAQKIVGYITLVCGEISVDREESSAIHFVDEGYHYKHYPAVKIARLAVDFRFRGNQLGKTLVSLALGQAKQVICPTVGCRFVVVDSKQQSIKFYEKCGFTKLDTLENRTRNAPVMWIDLSKLHLD